jgi:hypothetical protein
MEPNFDALQLIAELALGIVGFSAILIGLSRSSDGFSAPDNFRIQLLTYSAFGAMFGSILPFAIFSDRNLELAWLINCWIICIYSVIGLLLRKQGHKEIFPIKVYFFQTGILSIIFIISLLMIMGHLTELTNIYIVCLVLFLLQSTVAFIRTMFVRVQ